MKFWLILAVVVTIFLAFGQTLQMYFWQDDSALIFKLQNPLGPAGSYGEGIIGNGPYKYLITIFVPFFPIFNLNPFGYFLVGLIAYYISAGAFYLFVSELLREKKAAFFSTLIYAAGYIGSDTMLRISNSWQTNLGLILALLSFWAYIKFFRNNYKYLYYIIALFFFYSSIEFVFIRSHSMILPMLAIDLVFIAVSFKAAKIPMLFVRQLPFWYIFYTRYLIDRSEGGLGLSGFLKNLVTGKIEILSSFFATVGNSVIPSVLQAKFTASIYSRTQLVLLLLVIMFNWFLQSVVGSSRKLRILSTCFLVAAFLLNRFFIDKNSFWYRSQLNFVAGGLGLYTVVIVVGLSVLLWNKKKSLAVALILGLVILMSQVFGYFIKYPEAILTTTHRYLSYAFVGYSIIVGTICFLFFEIIVKKKYSLAFIPLVLVLASNLYLGVTYQNKILKDISEPTRSFYTTLKQSVPTVKKGDVFYFDIEDNSFYKSQFGNFFSVGSMPDSTALAIYYGVDRYDVSLIDDFNELLYKLSKGELSIDSIHSFHYGTSGLLNTSSSLRMMLKTGSPPKIVNGQNKNSTTVIFSDSAVLPLSPMLLTVKAQITPEFGNLIFPVSKDVSDEQRKKMAYYLLARQDYYRNVSPSSTSQWKFQEIVNATDNDFNTSWRAHRIYWHEHRQEGLVVNLGSLKTIGSVIWANWRHVQTPTSYTIDVSSDGKNWKTVKKVENGGEKKDGESTREFFNDEIAQFVRMNITQTLSGEEPALIEFEVVESNYNNVEPKQALDFINAPLNYFSQKEQLEQIFPQLAPLLNLRVTWETNKGKGETQLPIGAFGTFNTYEFILNAGGTTFNNITISAPNIPVKIDVKSSTLQNLSLSDIENRKLIKNLVEN